MAPTLMTTLMILLAGTALGVVGGIFAAMFGLWFGLIYFATLGLIPATIAHRRCLTDNYIDGEPHFDLADFVCWWTIGVAFFPFILWLSITKPFGTSSR